VNPVGPAARHAHAAAGPTLALTTSVRRPLLCRLSLSAIPVGSRIEEHLTQRPGTFGRLAEQFARAFPALGGVSFSYGPAPSPGIDLPVRRLPRSGATQDRGT